MTPDPVIDRRGGHREAGQRVRDQECPGVAFHFFSANFLSEIEF
jgi:hypothetical protein